MPVFETSYETPQPISVSVDLAIGDVRLDAGDRTDTAVEVRPSDPRSEADAKAAEDTRVEFAGGRLLVKGPKPRLFGRSGSVDVTVGLPAGSDAEGTGQLAAFHCRGRLGECRIKTSAGDIQLERTGRATLTTSLGDITADRVDGTAAITTGSGAVRVGALTGSAVIKNANGETRIGEAAGELRVRSANGTVTVGKAHAALEAKTTSGDIRIGEVVRGQTVLGTSSGRIEIGIAEGTAARLDVRTKAGNVLNSLTASDGPGAAAETAEVYAITSAGDITIRRAGAV
ncbi:DUF4097 family beta strand repeat-containing protein [Streptomyces sp. VNUA116]|uniref:DUF4097 family beta strand repeat-containing protein n=1 Tax=Streptomyces sp. VNUA116 TaxID=3062449 RepID=UPI0026756E7E|nr:DUF4097 family beta strand repeat-containing protein [Streptomyces sp. VNUA116]WKU48382.1 DUF4097 family beta strand repeat-containing protein [Streptomyces sp. VNUA116]